MTQSFNIPDSISADDLQELYENASDDGPTKASSDLTSEDLLELAEGVMNEMSAPLDGRQACLLHKIILHEIVEHQLEFHSKMGHALSEKGEHLPAVAWLRDAGKWQAIYDIASTIVCGDDDPTAVNA